MAKFRYCLGCGLVFRERERVGLTVIPARYCCYRCAAMHSRYLHRRFAGRVDWRVGQA